MSQSISDQNYLRNTYKLYIYVKKIFDIFKIFLEFSLYIVNRYNII